VDLSAWENGDAQLERGNLATGSMACSLGSIAWNRKSGWAICQRWRIPLDVAWPLHSTNIATQQDD
jgi:hypothetical protein